MNSATSGKGLVSDASANPLVIGSRTLVCHGWFRPALLLQPVGRVLTQIALFLLAAAGQAQANTPVLSVMEAMSDDGPVVEIRSPQADGTAGRLYQSPDCQHWTARETQSAAQGELRFQVPIEANAGEFFRVEILSVRPLETMVWIEPGDFLISSPPDEEGRFLDKEDPQTMVKLTRGYWISRFEVTQAEFQDVMEINPSLFGGEPRRPVENVTWFQAVRYCELVTERERAAGNLPTNYVYRLPTEGEWAHAARAGTATRFSYGNDPGYQLLRNYAWYTGNSGLRPHPVGQKLPNPWGLYDMHGNVFEWCSDWFGPLPGGTVTDPIGPESGVDRIIRGGYWDSAPAFCRCALRVHYPPETKISYLGFRIAMSEARPPAPTNP